MKTTQKPKAVKPVATPKTTLQTALREKRRVAMLEVVKKATKSALRSMLLAAGISVDKDAGILRNVAVASVGPCSGHGFSLDKTALETLCGMINAEPNGIVMHFRHPEVTRDAEGDVIAMEDQLGAIVGRLKSGRMDGDCLRGDVYFGTYAKKLPQIGDAWDYLASIAEEDPTAIGLSIVFVWDPETVLDSGGKPVGIVARPTQLFQVDFVENPASNRSGLLSAKRKAFLEAVEAEGVVGAMTNLAAMASAAVTGLRNLLDATVAGDAAVLVIACGTAATAAQAVTVAARICIDLCNALPSGGDATNGSDETAVSLTRQLRLLTDECADVLDVLCSLAWGTTDLARAAQAASPWIRTCLCTIDDARTCVNPMTYGPAYMAKKHAAADLLGLNVAQLSRRARVVRLARGLKRGQPFVGKKKL